MLCEMLCEASGFEIAAELAERGDLQSIALLGEDSVGVVATMVVGERKASLCVVVGEGLAGRCQ